MPITSLRITNFRNLSTLDLSPCQEGLNIIAGRNGSGKTSILEAIYYLALGRSFRSSISSRLIRHSQEKFSIFAQLLSGMQCYLPIGVERDLSGVVKSRIAEKDIASITELAYLLPLRIINSQSHNLFEAGPAYRRKYLDWGLFYQFESFLPCWRQFERVLKQRNTALRDKRPKQEIDVWTCELIKHGLELNDMRQQYIEALQPVAADLAFQLLDTDSFQLDYYPGWNDSHHFADILADHYIEEYRSGHTQFGPQRADLEIKIKGISAKHFLSRGQQKLLICAMILAQGMLLAEKANKGLIYLVDDLPSELDLHSRQKLISLLSRQSTQVFITSIESESICALLTESDVPSKVFHVEHGSVVAMA